MTEVTVPQCGRSHMASSIKNSSVSTAGKATNNTEAPVHITAAISAVMETLARSRLATVAQDNRHLLYMQTTGQPEPSLKSEYQICSPCFQMKTV